MSKKVSKVERTKGTTYRPTVTVMKAKHGFPTVVMISGNLYTYQSPDQFRK